MVLRGRGFMIKKIISYILLVLCIFLTFIFTFLVEIKWNIREEQMVRYLKNADLTFIMNSYNGIQNELLQNVENYLEAIHVPADAIEDVLNSDATKEFVGKYLSSVFSYLLYQKEDVTITKDDVAHLVDENFSIISATLQAQGLTLSEEEKNQIDAYVSEYSDRVLEFFPTANQILQKLTTQDVVLVNSITLSDITAFLRIILNPTFLISILGILLFLLGVLWLINKGKRCFYFKQYFFGFALILVLCEILLGTVIKEALMLRLESAETFINYMINEISKHAWIIILFAVVISFVLSRIERKENKNEKIFTELCEDNGEETREKSDEV